MFTTDDAFEAADIGDPIKMTRSAVVKMIERHSIDPDEFFDELGSCDDGEYDADAVLLWLGY